MQAILFFTEGKRGDPIAFYNRLPVFLTHSIRPPALLLVELSMDKSGKAYRASPIRQARYVEFGSRAWHPLSSLFDGSVNVRRPGHSSDTSIMYIWDETLEERYNRVMRDLAKQANVPVEEIESKPVEDPRFWDRFVFISTDPYSQAVQLLANYRKWKKQAQNP